MKQKYFINILNFVNGCLWVILMENHSTGFVNHHFKFDEQDASFLKN
jgi:hypothetical protein